MKNHRPLEHKIKTEKINGLIKLINETEQNALMLNLICIMEKYHIRGF